MHLFPKELPEQLDFHILLKEISKECQNKAAIEICLNTTPLSNPQAILKKLSQVNELISLLQSDENLPSAQFETIEKALSLLKTPGSLLEERFFIDIKTAANLYHSIYSFLQKKKERTPETYLLFIETPSDLSIVKSIDKVFDDKGIVRSNASRELQDIRAKLNKARITAERVFSRVLKKYHTKGLLADFNESVSENRRVLAVQSSFKGQINGIFHASSAKQSIVYIEPGESVEHNNLVASLIDDEKKEIQRILRQLDTYLRPKIPFLKTASQLLIDFDFLRAKAHFSFKQEACVPKISAEGKTELIQAYNPVLVLFNKQKSKETIPLDLKLDEHDRILVISGPNAGGKSISLKTLGLLQLMLQSGFPVPVHPDSHFQIFDKIMADIGDAQSIENELSTYSSKLQKMKHFLEHAGPNTLLMLDEFGSGSDPDLGSSLAQVFLTKLNNYKCWGIFTTHYSAIKSLAAQTAGVVNGAMLFNRKTFKPEYRLQIGQPGSSYTFEVAQDSGIPSHIIQEARDHTHDAMNGMDQLLVALQEDKLQLERKEARLNSDLRNLQSLQDKQKHTIQLMEEKLSKQGKMNEENDKLISWGAKFQKLVESWRVQSSQKDKKEIVARFIAMINQRSSETQKLEKVELSKAQKKRAAQIEKLKEVEIKPGDFVKIIDSGLRGNVLEIKGNKYSISIGGNMQTSLSRDKFIPAKAELQEVRALNKKVTKAPIPKKGTAKKPDVKSGKPKKNNTSKSLKHKSSGPIKSPNPS